jgi:hypothetical protein
MDLVKLLLAHKATAQASADRLGGTNTFLQGYLMGIEHALQLAQIQELRLSVGLPCGPEGAK